MRLGLLGGSFDPVHYGHLLLGECCRVACRLEQVWFLPAAQPPHKVRPLGASGPQRAEMLEMAVADHPAFHVCRLELERGGVSYTAETLAAIRSQVPSAELFLLLGADMLADLPTWREPREICRLATPVVARRAGTPEPNFEPLTKLLPQPEVDRIRNHLVDMPPVGYSST
ncbi:MAG: nicotinate (nicotinamide) nucleotide adenylyltransferase, partial [Planctomycetes bacterium RBG_16_64_10]